MERASLAQLLKTIGLTLLVVHVLARIGFGLYAVSIDPSLTLFSWEGLHAVLSTKSLAAIREDLPIWIAFPLGMAGLGGVVLWLAGWLLGLRRSPS